METIESRIGYHFANPLLLEEALTHPSLAYETKRQRFDNQRLEYLGDAVIQLIFTHELFHLFPKFSEGKLTKLRSRLVSREALCRFAETIKLGHHLRLGKGEDTSGGRERPSNLADALEALAGAIYLDGGLDPARAFILNNFAHFIEEIAREPGENNPKGELQEQLQALTPSSPSYRIISQEGPDHEKVFVSEVTWEGLKLGRGEGASKKEAEVNAASVALKEKRWAGFETGE
ncbi:MAG: ribonuclease III [Verrucomicrobiales bacterium]|nr:ribonuclease III [Verrucomicrobiales bacterium]